MDTEGFYGPEQAAIHDAEFGDLAREAGDFLVELLQARGLTAGHVTDLGCGSGILAARLLGARYAVTGTDCAPAMVALARSNAPGATFSVGSLLETEIPTSVAVCAIGEALNYATDPRAGLSGLASVAARAHSALVPGGVLLFDVSTPGRNLGLAVRHVFHRHDTWCLGMRATESGARLDREITIFVAEPDGRWRRVDEHHVLHLYAESEVVQVLEAEGFAVEVRTRYGAGLSAPTPLEGWKVFVATR